MNTQFILDIIINSFTSWLVLPLGSEIQWFSLLIFQPEEMLLPTIAAVIASSIALFTSYALGWLLAMDRKHMPLSDEKYNKAAAFSQQWLLGLFIIPWIPLLPLLAVVIGFLRCSLWRWVALAIIGRVIYYSYYLYS
jgi:membrane protein YqaA with SNARE-associated domain